MEFLAGCKFRGLGRDMSDLGALRSLGKQILLNVTEVLTLNPIGVCTTTSVKIITTAEISSNIRFPIVTPPMAPRS